MTTNCERCDGTGVASSYSGTVIHPYGQLAVEREHRHPLHDLPGGRFYGGSSHMQCPNCDGTGVTQ
jgi:hypothetical protein